MLYHNITHFDMLNGEGVRTVLWVSGCEHACFNCHNKITWNHDIGIEFDQAAKEEIFKELDKDYVSGITFSGGDPLSLKNRDTILEFATEIKEKYPNKTIWCYTGYTFENVRDLDGIELIDVIVDGKYIDCLDIKKPLWRGSSNQRIIDVKKSLKNNEIITYIKGV